VRCGNTALASLLFSGVFSRVPFAFGRYKMLSPLVPFRESLQGELLSNTINQVALF
jgi:hypothetical protein